VPKKIPAKYRDLKKTVSKFLELLLNIYQLISLPFGKALSIGFSNFLEMLSIHF